MFLTPRRSTKENQLQLTNSFVTSHDLTCSCQKPAFHCFLLLAKQLGPELSPQEKTQILQCLGETTTGTDVTEREDHGLEDLEELFAEGASQDTG